MLKVAFPIRPETDYDFAYRPSLSDQIDTWIYNSVEHRLFVFNFDSNTHERRFYVSNITMAQEIGDKLISDMGWYIL